jgi:hypothetical protein
MSDMGEKIEKEIVQKLRGIVEEEELHAMIDAALPRVREAMEAQVATNVQELAKRQLEPFFSTHYYESERFEAMVAKIADALIARVVSCYEEDAAAIREGEQPPHAVDTQDYSRRWGSKEPIWKSRLHELIAEGFERRLVNKIEDLIRDHLDRPELDEKADRVLANLLPKAASSFLESGGLRVIQRFNETVRFGMNPSCGACPSCHRQLRACGSCGTLQEVGASCCGMVV